MWPTMFIYITAQILSKFHFSSPLSYLILFHCPTAYGFDFTIFFLNSLYEGALWLLFSWKFSIYIFSFLYQEDKQIKGLTI